MIKHVGMQVGLTVLLLLGAGLAFAQEEVAEPVTVMLNAFIVSTTTNDDGEEEETFTEAAEARPGQVVEYRVTAMNEGETTLPAGNVVVTGPVPAGTTYLGDSATTESQVNLTFSADEGQTFSAPPVMITVTNDEGEEEVEAAPEQYSAVRWTVERALEPEESLEFSYRVTVE